MLLLNEVRKIPGQIELEWALGKTEIPEKSLMSELNQEYATRRIFRDKVYNIYSRSEREEIFAIVNGVAGRTSEILPAIEAGDIVMFRSKIQQIYTEIRQKEQSFQGLPNGKTIRTFQVSDARVRNLTVDREGRYSNHDI